MFNIHRLMFNIEELRVNLPVVVFTFYVCLASAVFLMRKFLLKAISRFQSDKLENPLTHPNLADLPFSTSELKSLHRVRLNRLFKSKVTWRNLTDGRVRLITPQKIKKQLKALLTKQKSTEILPETPQPVVTQVEGLEPTTLNSKNLEVVNQDSNHLKSNDWNAHGEMIATPGVVMFLNEQSFFTKPIEQASSEESVRSLRAKNTSSIQTPTAEAQRLPEVQRGLVEDLKSEVLTQDRSTRKKPVDTLFTTKIACSDSHCSMATIDSAALDLKLEVLTQDRSNKKKSMETPPFTTTIAYSESHSSVPTFDSEALDLKSEVLSHDIRTRKKSVETLFTTKLACCDSHTSVCPFDSPALGNLRRSVVSKGVDGAGDLISMESMDVTPTESGNNIREVSSSVITFDSEFKFTESYVSIGFRAIPYREYEELFQS